jgi:hypothetical protein
MSIITGKDDIKVPKDRIGEQQPRPGVYERVGKKIRLDYLVLEKCLIDRRGRLLRRPRGITPAVVEITYATRPGCTVARRSLANST